MFSVMTEVLWCDLTSLDDETAAQRLADFINEHVAPAFPHEVSPTAKAHSPAETLKRFEQAMWSVVWEDGWPGWGLSISGGDGLDCTHRHHGGSMRSGVHYADPESGPFVLHLEAPGWYFEPWGGCGVLLRPTYRTLVRYDGNRELTVVDWADKPYCFNCGATLEPSLLEMARDAEVAYCKRCYWEQMGWC